MMNTIQNQYKNLELETWEQEDLKPESTKREDPKPESSKRKIAKKQSEIESEAETEVEGNNTRDVINQQNVNFGVPAGKENIDIDNTGKSQAKVEAAASPVKEVKPEARDIQAEKAVDLSKTLPLDKKPVEKKGAKRINKN